VPVIWIATRNPVFWFFLAALEGVPGSGIIRSGLAGTCCLSEQGRAQEGPRILVSYLIRNPKAIWLRLTCCRALSSPAAPERPCGNIHTRTPARPRGGLCFCVSGGRKSMRDAGMSDPINLNALQHQVHCPGPRRYRRASDPYVWPRNLVRVSRLGG
jgi:hypothetical protein